MPATDPTLTPSGQTLQRRRGYAQLAHLNEKIRDARSGDASPWEPLCGAEILLGMIVGLPGNGDLQALVEAAIETCEDIIERRG